LKDFFNFKASLSTYLYIFFYLDNTYVISGEKSKPHA